MFIARSKSNSRRAPCSSAKRCVFSRRRISRELVMMMMMMMMRCYDWVTFSCIKLCRKVALHRNDGIRTGVLTCKYSSLYVGPSRISFRGFSYDGTKIRSVLLINKLGFTFRTRPSI